MFRLMLIVVLSLTFLSACEDQGTPTGSGSGSDAGTAPSTGTADGSGVVPDAPPDTTPGTTPNTPPDALTGTGGTELVIPEISKIASSRAASPTAPRR